MASTHGDSMTKPDSGQGLHLSNLSQRLLTSVILLPIVVFATAVGGWVFAIVAGVIAVIGILEFYGIMRHRGEHPIAPLGVVASAVVPLILLQPNAPALIGIVAGFSFGLTGMSLIGTRTEATSLSRRLLITWIGVCYVAFPAGFLVALRLLPDGLIWVLLVYALTWGTDTFSYIGGRLWGKTPLAPRVSPKKTREGAVTGVIGAFLAALVLLVVYDKFQPVFLPLLLLAPILGIAGDLLESALKRTAHMKDSHLVGLNIFPGHGGVLDRIDSLIFVVTLTYLFIMIVVQTGVASLPS